MRRQLATLEIGAILLTLGTAVPAGAAPPPTSIRLVTELNGKCLDVGGVSPRQGAPTTVRGCTGGYPQYWYWDGERLRSTQNHRCLDVYGAGTGENVQVVTWHCHDQSHQRWYWDGLKLRSRLNGKCLGVANSSTADGARVVVAGCRRGETAQKWHL